MTEENKQPNQQQEANGDMRKTAITGLRFVQVLALALVAVGFIWGLGDWIDTLMPEGTDAPISLLLMIYGLVGSAMVEIPIRVLQRRIKK